MQPLHSCKTIKNLLENNKEIQFYIKEISNKLPRTDLELEKKKRLIIKLWKRENMFNNITENELNNLVNELL